MNAAAQLLLASSRATENELPQSAPLTLTRNFGMVVVFCFVTLCTVPLFLAWVASLVLNST